VLNKEGIQDQIRNYFENGEINQKYLGKWKVPLSVPPYDWKEVNEVIDSLLEIKLTMGHKVKQFEAMFAKYIGTKHAIMFNSGSSANLVALDILKMEADSNGSGRNEVITPSVTWPTSIYPIVNAGLVPRIVDVDLENFNMSMDEINNNINEKTLAIMPVHLLGNPMNMTEISSIANKNDLFVIEDCCEAHGAEYNKIKVGKFGDMGTFSFYASHHITTGEGGMLVTDNDKYAEIARSLRAFGWIRDSANKKQISKKYPHIDNRFLFMNMGYNFKPTELMAAFGIHQIKKLDSFIKNRQKTADYWNSRLSRYSDKIAVQRQEKNSKHVWFGYPITINKKSGINRDDLMKYLESHSIETRPIAAGNMLEQPSIKLFKHKSSRVNENSKIIMRDSFFIGNHNLIGDVERKYVADVIIRFLESKK
jgi:CDP-6-deoxy-D-xylo-4-hexulose-3-dehydrase